MGEATLDPKELLDRMTAEHRALRWGPLAPDEPRDTGGDRVPLDRSSLEYLHRHWALAEASTAPATGHGLRSRGATLFSRLTLRALGPHLQREQEFLAHAVQVIDDLDRRCTQLAQRVQELETGIIDRQVAEAENQAKLALWLHLEPPAVGEVGGPTPAPVSGEKSSTG